MARCPWQDPTVRMSPYTLSALVDRLEPKQTSCWLNKWEMKNSLSTCISRLLLLGTRPRLEITPPPCLPLPRHKSYLTLPEHSISISISISISSPSSSPSVAKLGKYLQKLPITLFCDAPHCLKTSGKPDKTSRHTKATKGAPLWAKAGMICLAICGVMKSASRARVVAVKTCVQAQGHQAPFPPCVKLVIQIS